MTLSFFVSLPAMILPHLPSLDIREGGIETLLKEYKAMMPSLGGYLTDNGRVIIGRTEMDCR